MTTAAPPDIRRFETVSIVSIILGLINQAVANDGLFEAVIGEALILFLTLFVSRRRKNWARWILLIMFVLGAAFMIWNATAVVALGFPLLTVAVTVLQVVALVLVFTNQSSNWLRYGTSSK